jgi:hypothetical protein
MFLLPLMMNCSPDKNLGVKGIQERFAHLGVVVSIFMAFDPLPPLTPTLTLTPKAKIPPDLPSDPSISMLFPKVTPY